jgi:hypothetical protein
LSRVSAECSNIGLYEGKRRSLVMESCIELFCGDMSTCQLIREMFYYAGNSVQKEYSQNQRF